MSSIWRWGFAASEFVPEVADGGCEHVDDREASRRGAVTFGLGAGAFVRREDLAGDPGVW